MRQAVQAGMTPLEYHVQYFDFKQYEFGRAANLGNAIPNGTQKLESQLNFNLGGSMCN